MTKVEGHADCFKPPVFYATQCEISQFVLGPQFSSLPDHSRDQRKGNAMMTQQNVVQTGNWQASSWFVSAWSLLPQAAEAKGTL